MDTSTIVAVVVLAMVCASVGAGVRELLSLYVAPWPGVPPCTGSSAGSIAARRLFGAGPPPEAPKPHGALESALSPAGAAQAAVDDAGGEQAAAWRASSDAAAAGGDAVGGAAAAAAPRALGASPAACPGLFPAATFICNVAGCLILGIVARLSGDLQWSPLVLAAVGAGFCGGLTTQSTFVNELVQLCSSGQAATAVLYWFTTQGACILLGWGGWALAGVRSSSL